MTVQTGLVEQIRNRIIGEMHLGHLRGGDRLPAVREMSKALNADHRAVGAAYRALEAEGLIEVRGRAGTFLCVQERLGGVLLGETASWLASILAEARRRRVALADFPELVRACTSNLRLRCACIESNRDSSTSLMLELEEELGVEAAAVAADDLPRPSGSLRQDGRGDLPEGLVGADFLVTTAFHAPAARGVAQALQIPLVVATVPSEMVGIIERRVQSHGLTVLVADVRYGDRFRDIYSAQHPEKVRVVPAEDRKAVGRLDRSEPVLATRAARLILPDLDLPLLLPRYPVISPESSRDIIEILIRLNIGSEGAAAA